MAVSIDPKLKKELAKEDLTYSSDKTPGFFRQKSGRKNFIYYDLVGHKIRDKKILERIDSLGIPPAWENVWICPRASGHMQVTGIDEKRRKQYIYHPDWVKLSQQNKFSKIIDFGESLPYIRSSVRHNMLENGHSKKKITATIIWLLENTFIRIGNEEYASENDSFGLTTLRNKHVEVKGNEIKFDFKGKSGVQHEIEISNPVVAKTVKKCIELPGYELFQFIGDDGDRHVVDSSDVNMFLKDVTGDDFTAKDFRTWGGTSIAANNFYQIGHEENKTARKKKVVETIKKVASQLGNTVAVCRSYYIHPTVFQTYDNNILVPHFAYYEHSKPQKRGLSWDEYSLIRLLQKYP